MFRLIKILIIVLMLLVMAGQSARAQQSQFAEAMQWFTAQKYQQAKAAFKQLQQQDANTAWYYLGRIYYQQGDFAGALDYFEQALTQSPNHADEYYWLGLTNAELIKDAFFLAKPRYASAIEEAFLQAIATEPNHLEAHIGLFYFYLSAPAIVGGSSKKAWQQIQSVDAIDSHQSALLTLNYHSEQSDDNTLVEYINTQLQEADKGKEWLFKAGLAAQQKKHYELAQRCFTQAQSPAPAVGLNYHRIASLYQLGRTAVLAERFIKSGIMALEQYLTETLEPGHPPKTWAKYRLSQLYRLNNDNTASQRLLNQLAQADITDPELKALLKR
ncbi:MULTISPECIES: tetratricopeptide repeat protein [unclassified Pseudoalteromonas]|uniref:tetratricopeptide repeat protein n=1 Tax=unclassified Pseudoalteromonas TaxID=194690 RepID=UPI003014E5AB